MLRLTSCCLAAFGAACLAIAQVAIAEDAPDAKLTIEAQSLSKALLDFSEKTGLQIGYSAELTDGKVTQGVKAADDANVALSTILASTGLEYEFVNHDTVVIRAASSGEAATQMDSARSQSVQQDKVVRQNPPLQDASVPESSVRVDGELEQAGNSSAPRPSSILDEVIVTAQKREQSLQDVGVAVTAFTGEQISEFGFTTSTDLVDMTPGLNYTVPNAESSQINFFLRGVGLNDFADANENPVAVYMDDIYRPAMGGLSFHLFDIERVEVLRGPQSALFGRNTNGGLVHYLSRRPSEERDGHFSISLGSHSETRLEAALGGGTSQVSARFAAAMHKHDGYTENRTGPDYNETDAIGLRGQVRFAPSDDFDALINAYYSDNDASVGAWQHEATTINANGESVALGPTEQSMGVDCNADGMLDQGDLRPAPGTDCFGYRDVDGDPYAGDFDRDGRVEAQSSGVAVTLNWNLGLGILTSITGVQTVERLQSEDTDAGPFPLLQPTFAAETDTLTQELRLASETSNLRWLFGLYYFDNEVNGRYDLDLTNLDFVYFDVDYTQVTESLAFFGQVEYDLTSQWTFIFGARMAGEDKELDYINRDTAGFFTGIIGLPTDVAFDFDQESVGDLAMHDEDSFSGKLELDWRPNEDLLVYGSVSRGVKSAGFNVGFLDGNFIFASNSVETVPYGPETLTSLEVGFKSTFAAGRARLNGSAFYYDYEDFQTFRFELLNQIIFNSNAKVQGLELELQSTPADGWDVALGLALLDATAEGIPTPAGDALRDRSMVAAPEVSLTGMLRYEWSALGGTLSAMVWGNWQSSMYFDIQNVPVSEQDAYSLGNLRVAFRSADERWEVGAFVHNIADEEYKRYSFDFTGTFGFNQLAYGKPRWAGVSFRYSF